MLCERLVAEGEALAEAWNFGPAHEDEVTVSSLLKRLIERWGSPASWQTDAAQHPHEASFLSLDCSKAAERLSWRPLWDLDEGLGLTVEWYRGYARDADMRALTLRQIGDAVSAARAGHRDVAALTPLPETASGE
jgi:CDP-glucose 4,6-dehydratase